MFEEHYKFRESLVQALMRDLVGPTSPQEVEVITDAPITRYASGILFPQSHDPVDPMQDQDYGDDYDEDALPDPPVAMANTRYPSSFGLTFTVDTSLTRRIRIVTTAARYLPYGVEEEGPTPLRHRGLTAAPERWQRMPLVLEPQTVDVSIPTAGTRLRLAPGLDLYYRVRQAGAGGTVAVTVVMLNTNLSGPSGSLRDADAFFQPTITVTAETTGASAFVERPAEGFFDDDEDLASYRLLYRNAKFFATGHGCSVEWEVDAGSSAARALRTTFTPRHELLLADSNPTIDSPALGLRHLTETAQSQIIDELHEFLGGYQAWLAAEREECQTLDDELQPTAVSHLDAVAEACRRIGDGLALLARDADSWSAFVLMNRAMLQLRARGEWLRNGKTTEEPVEGPEHRWRPFQLAFILLCVSGLVEPSSTDRAIADLLWFPTGGGKTEAYFGLIAFTLFHRRLREPGELGGGVAVLMRYTLRLLTIQQFERASLLICCCERLRQSDSRLGSQAISLGLWVGAAGTPNTLDDARRSLDRLRANEQLQLEEKNPMQLHACPWCGEPLDHRNYYLADNPRRLVIACRQQSCSYGRGLPVHVVDEDLYRARPSLVIATADKYASLPWSDHAAHLFNLSGTPARAPELIIQDELHLISGPLGTLAGLYETAIDRLCSQDSIRPKVVASTATIRRARQQSSGLFDRDVRQFPPPGLDGADSYFAVQSSRESRGARLYMGLMAPGVSQSTLLIRAYAALLQFGATLHGSDATRDAYWTLVGYFNSLRVLGGARMQVQDDVGDRIELLAGQAGTAARPLDYIELTSREPSGMIPAHLKRMTVAFPDRNALDVILATNMISVGVDIDRLGLMVVMGQPQSTSEYIQATSRVGRKWPGLVVVLFNAARSRDRSHYESFVPYHSALYRQVESTSVTPFSSRARDRALHAVVIALARLLLPGYKSNTSARRILTNRDDLEVVKRVILDRVAHVAPEEQPATEAELEAVLDEWEDRARANPDLLYSSPAHPERSLLQDAGMAADGYEEGFATLRSLRDVDQASNLFLVWG